MQAQFFHIGGDSSFGFSFSDGDSSEREDRFRSLALAYQAFVNLAGHDLVAFRESHIPLFRSQTLSQQNRILEDLSRSVQVCQNFQAQGQRIDDTRALLWWALKALNLRPPSNLFDYIAEDSILEVYNRHGEPVFRNFNFYSYCGYSLEELYCFSPSVLLERDTEVSATINRGLEKVFAGEIIQTSPAEIPLHRVKEKFSPELNELLLKIESFSPLFIEKTSTPGAALVIQTATLVHSKQKTAFPAAQSKVKLRPRLELAPSFQPLF